jgi:hypothetical protein
MGSAPAAAITSPDKLAEHKLAERAGCQLITARRTGTRTTPGAWRVSNLGNSIPYGDVVITFVTSNRRSR